MSLAIFSGYPKVCTCIAVDHALAALNERKSGSEPEGTLTIFPALQKANFATRSEILGRSCYCSIEFR